MKYIKADAVFPERLLREIQKYVHGELVYIPNPRGIRKKWGETSGHKEYLFCRNNQIHKEFHAGLTVDQLSDKFCLSVDSIKKIVYQNNY